MPENRENQTRRIVSVHPNKIRMASTLNLRGIFPQYVFGIIIFFLFTDVIANICGIYFPRSSATALIAQAPSELAKQIPEIPYVVVIYTMFMFGAFEMGRAFYALTVLRNRTLNPELVFEGFSFYFRATQIYLIQTILEAIGMMCFVVPGFILQYSYSQAYYIYADDPSKGAIQCLRESRMRMQGNKLSLLKLDISYLVVILIGYLPALLLSLYTTMDLNTLGGTAVYYLVRVPYYIALASLYMGHTVFYELLTFGSFDRFKFMGEEMFRSLPDEFK